MVKVIVIEGTTEEVKAIWPQTVGTAVPAVVAPKGGTAKVPDSWTWDEERVLKVWKGLTSEAKRVLKEMQTKPSGYPQGDLQKTLGGLKAGGLSLGARLSSVGHQVRRQGFKGLPPPVQRAYGPGGLVYTLHPIWQQTLEKHLGAGGTLTP